MSDPAMKAGFDCVEGQRPRLTHFSTTAARFKTWRDDLCLARTLLAAPFGPSTMCFLGTALCLGCVVPF